MVKATLGELCTVDIGPLRYCARRWGTPDGVPVMLLHGWLDNCASFAFLAPLLEQANAVAVDLAGHGLSSSRGGLNAYSLWGDVGDVFRIADQLGWPRFHIVGHSRGAMLAFIAAGTFPERVRSLFLLEGVYPKGTEAQHAPARLRQAITEVNRFSQRARQHYRSFNEAVRARERGLFPLAQIDALALAEHGVVEETSGFYWQYDPKLLAVAEVGFSQAQIDAFAAAQTCHAEVFLAADGAVKHETVAWLAQRDRYRVTELVGGHHMHMHQQAHAIAATIAHNLNSKG